MMVDPIFPSKSHYASPEMTDRVWETYCMMVWCNNSLNAMEGVCKKKHDEESPRTAILLARAQSVINFLLEETGRSKEFKEYEERMNKNEENK